MQAVLARLSGEWSVLCSRAAAALAEVAAVHGSSRKQKNAVSSLYAAVSPPPCVFSTSLRFSLLVMLPEGRVIGHALPQSQASTQTTADTDARRGVDLIKGRRTDLPGPKHMPVALFKSSFSYLPYESMEDPVAVGKYGPRRASLSYSQYPTSPLPPPPSPAFLHARLVRVRRGKALSPRQRRIISC